MKTRESLGVFWNGEETDGIIVYAFWARDELTPPSFPVKLWPSDAEVKPRSSKLFRVTGVQLECPSAASLNFSGSRSPASMAAMMRDAIAWR